jgi:hypothetical protein
MSSNKRGRSPNRSRSNSRKRGNPSPSRDSPHPPPPPIRTRPPPPDSEIITQLLGSFSKIDFISDDSLYSFILQGKMPIESPAACVSGVEVSSFCVKITFVNKGGPNEYVHTTTKGGEDTEKKAIDVREIDKEAVIQRELYDSFSAPFVPRVFASSIFRSKEFTELFESLLTSQRVVFDKNARLLVETILKEHVKKHPMWDVNIFLMEYMDKPYATLYVQSFPTTPERSLITPALVKDGYQRMAANLACAAGVGVILYDAHNKNGLYDRNGDPQVVLLDFSDAFDVKVKSDITKMEGNFTKMVRVNKHLIPHLCRFFSVTDESKLVNAFVANLTFTDFRTQGPNIHDIHHSLMMVAFVDFMIHADGEYIPPGIRCRYAMESIYGKTGTLHSDSYFEDFDIFLDTFTPILSSDAYNKELSAVARFITGIITPTKKKITQQCSLQGGKRKNKSKRNIRKTKKYRRILYI